MSTFQNLDISSSGMRANRTWMEVISQNIANANTTKTSQGGPYKNKVVSFSSVLNAATASQQNQGLVEGGVQVGKITEDNSPFIKVFNPSHPDADSNGYVQMPNVNPSMEMVNMIMATRSYEANVGAFNTGKGMYLKALEIGK